MGKTDTTSTIRRGATLKVAHLRIPEPNEFLNMVSGTYKDFFRAAMEYVDNAIDAAETLRQDGIQRGFLMSINIDTQGNTISFKDNCGGMSPEDLCNLVSRVGSSNKKHAPWTNGQFGFGVQAFRAFAKRIEFLSKKKGSQEAAISIDRDAGHDEDVVCHLSNENVFQNEEGTLITISRFDPHVFKKAQMKLRLLSEIEHHFDEVLRHGNIKILIFQDGKNPCQCKFFDYENLPGVPFRRNIPLICGKKYSTLVVDLRILNIPNAEKSVALTNKYRRIQIFADLKSYKTFLRSKGVGSQIWANPFLVGSIEISDFCSPDLTRDDLKDSPEREVLFGCLLDVQNGLEQTVQDIMNLRSQESYSKLSNFVSQCLDNILKRFSMQFEQPIVKESQLNQSGLAPAPETKPLKKEANENSPELNEKQSNRVGEGKAFEGSAGTSKPTVEKTKGPAVRFIPYPSAPRSIPLPNEIIINTAHNDFKLRCDNNKSGDIGLTPRLINYVSLIVAPFCVHHILERKGELPSPKELTQRVIDLELQIEGVLYESRGLTIERT